MRKIIAVIVGVVMLSMPLWVSEYVGNMYPQVSLSLAQVDEYQPYVYCTGTVSKNDDNGIFFEFPMYAKTIDVDVGEKVVVGQRLFTVDVEKTAEQIITMAKAYEKYLPAYLNKSLVEKIVNVSLQEFIDMNYLPRAVYSSQNGVVSEINVSNSMLNDPVRPVVSYKEGTEFFLTLQVGEEDYDKISQNARVVGTTAIGVDVEGTVTSIYPSIKTSFSPTGSKKIIEFTAKILDSTNIMPDTSVSAKIYYGDKASGIVVPYTAVGQDEGGEYVYTYDGEIHKQYIQDTLETPNGYLIAQDVPFWIVSDIERFEATGNKSNRILPIYTEVMADE